MNRLSIWPDFRDSWVIHDDGDLLVVEKPEGISAQAADPDRPDDLVSRLRAHLGGAYLGVHQRLDRDTSGLTVFARRREANASLAEQFEGRSVRKKYVACVSGWPSGRDRATLRDLVVAGEGGTMRVAPRGDRDAKAAVTRVRVLSRRAERAMLELDLETGRTHQARVQLAHAKSPIAGDILYGGVSAPRLMLHASAIELRHPISARPVRFASPPPGEFQTWLERGSEGEAIYDDEPSLERALRRAVERRWGLGRSVEQPARATNAFRLVHEDGDGLPRLAVDVYDRWLVAQFYEADDVWVDGARRERVLDQLHALGFQGIYLKVRPRQANTLTRESEVDRARRSPPLPERGSPAPAECGVLEEGMPLLVRLGEGLSTGLFLDQRQNRRRVRVAAAGQSVANLFAYTCAFTVAAALGGARKTVSVDASLAALERGRANLDHAGALAGGDHAFVGDDVFAWVERAARRGERFDLVVLDPPSYSSTRRGRFVAETDYGDLVASVLPLVAPRGKLLACTNHRGISSDRFRRILHDAARKAGRPLGQIKDLPPPPDYPIAPGGHAHAKSAWVTCR